MTMKFKKCPVCGAGVVLEFPDGTFACDNEHCKSYEESDTTTYDLLIQSLKDLLVARKALEEIRQKGLEIRATPFAMGLIADKALEQIGHKA